MKEGYLINPTVVDARTEITTELLSEKGFVVSFTDDTGEDQQEAFKQREFEKRFFAEATNQIFCKTFLESTLRDPVSGEIGKSIIFAVSQNHAAKLAQILNQMADRMFPGKYQSDFAVQVTSTIPDAQQFTVNFSNNNLLGSANFLPSYKTSKARVCVTVGMMTTGYDCTDILNLGLPPLAMQQAIVAEIEAEKALVAANRELIARFEKKIQAVFARVWGGGSD